MARLWLRWPGAGGGRAGLCIFFEIELTVWVSWTYIPLTDGDAAAMRRGCFGLLELLGAFST